MSNTNKYDLFKHIVTLEKEVLDFGFYWDNLEQILNQIRNECIEVKEAYEKSDRAHLKEEVGDLIHATMSLAVFLNLDPKLTLEKSMAKMQKRFNTLVELVKADGLPNLHHKPTSVKMSYWDKAKKSDHIASY